MAKIAGFFVTKNTVFQMTIDNNMQYRIKSKKKLDWLQKEGYN